MVSYGFQLHIYNNESLKWAGVVRCESYSE